MKTVGFTRGVLVAADLIWKVGKTTAYESVDAIVHAIVAGACVVIPGVDVLAKIWIYCTVILWIFVVTKYLTPASRYRHIKRSRRLSTDWHFK
jgi:hypothetical protein